MTFEIGFIPQGWQRGQPLTIITPSGTSRGFISLDSSAGLPDGDFEQALSYELAEATTVAVWLTWWASGLKQDSQAA